MSHKVTTFTASCPAPKTADRFIVVIPGLVNSLRVSSATFPQQSRSTVTIYAGGQPVHVPGKSQVPGTWSCILDESLLEDASLQIQWLKARVRTTFSDIKRYSLLDICIFLTDQITGSLPTNWSVLRGAWIESVSPLQLDWSAPDRPIRWQVTFRYSYIDRYPVKD